MAILIKHCEYCGKEIEILYPSWGKKRFCDNRCKCLGKKQSLETRKKRSKALLGHPFWGGMTGKHQTDATKEKIRKALTKPKVPIKKTCPDCGKSYFIKRKTKDYNLKPCLSCAMKRKYKVWLKNGTEQKRRKKISIYNLKSGRKPPSALGYKFTLEQRIARGVLQKRLSKLNHPNPITPLTKKIRHSVEYDIWRKSVFQRNDYTCQICNNRGGSLIAHHIKRFSIIFKENNIDNLEKAFLCKELWDVNNGQTLCVKCH